MEVGELAKLHAKKQELRGKREGLVQEELRKKRREKVNLDQSAVKKGYIEKHKYIAKRKFETVVEKARKAPVELQDNVNVNTFLNQSANYEKILARTKGKVVLDDQLLTESLTAINAFGR